MTKIKITTVTARESLAPGSAPFFRITCQDCGHDAILEPSPGTLQLHGTALVEAYCLARLMFEHHLTLDGRGGSICPIGLFEHGELDERIEEAFAPITCPWCLKDDHEMEDCARRPRCCATPEAHYTKPCSKPVQIGDSWICTKTLTELITSGEKSRCPQCSHPTGVHPIDPGSTIGTKCCVMCWLEKLLEKA